MAGFSTWGLTRLKSSHQPTVSSLEAQLDKDPLPSAFKLLAQFLPCVCGTEVLDFVLAISQSLFSAPKGHSQVFAVWIPHRQFTAGLFSLQISSFRKDPIPFKDSPNWVMLTQHNVLSNKLEGT